MTVASAEKTTIAMNDELASALAWLSSPPTDLAPFDFGNAREDALVRGLKGLASSFGKVIKPTRIDGRGDMSFALDNGMSGISHPTLGYQVYGDDLAAILSRVPHRTGTDHHMHPVLGCDNWLYINHFDVERLLKTLI